MGASRAQGRPLPWAKVPAVTDDAPFYDSPVPSVIVPLGNPRKRRRVCHYQSRRTWVPWQAACQATRVHNNVYYDGEVKWSVQGHTAPEEPTQDVRCNLVLAPNPTTVFFLKTYCGKFQPRTNVAGRVR